VRSRKSWRDCRPRSSAGVLRTSLTHGYLLDEWLRMVELEDSTRATYVGYFERTIRPTLRAVSIAKLTTGTVKTLYAELRRSRALCDGRPSVAHRAEGSNDCVTARCAMHVCKPMAASTVRQVHAVLGGALSAALRLDLVAHEPGPRRSAASSAAAPA
jgi:integrase